MPEPDVTTSFHHLYHLAVSIYHFHLIALSICKEEFGAHLKKCSFFFNCITLNFPNFGVLVLLLTQLLLFFFFYIYGFVSYNSERQQDSGLHS